MWASDLGEALERLQVDRATYVAWSYAGLVLASLLDSARRPPVASVVLVAAATRAGSQESMTDFGERAIPPELLSSDALEFYEGQKQFVAECAGEVPFSDGDFSELLSIVTQTSAAPFAPMLSAQYSFEDYWKEDDTPLWLVHGTADRINLPVISERQSLARPDARLTLVPGVGHLPFWEQPDKFSEALAAWAGSHG